MIIRQAIETRYLGPTNTKGSRIKAECHAGWLTYGWQFELNMDENHREAARRLVEKLGWLQYTHHIVGGALKKALMSGHCFRLT